MAKYEFAIKKDVLNSGKTIYTPVCRKKSRFGKLNILPNPWERIVNIYDEFLLMEIDWTPELSYKECEQHIQGYQQVLLKKNENDVATVEFHVLEEKQI